MSASTLVQLEIKNAQVNAKLTDGVEFEEFGDHVDNVALTTTTVATLFNAVSGNTLQRVQPFQETLVLNIGQSVKAGSLWMFLRENHGKTGVVEILPTGGQTDKITADVTFQAPGVLGGIVGAGLSGATLLVNGQAAIASL